MATVLFIAGAMRSGSTVLGVLLGNLPGFLDVGEIGWFWRHLADGRPCGCGVALPACPFWARVLDELGAVDRSDAERLAGIAARLDRTRGVLLARGHGARTRAHWEELVAASGRLYAAVGQVGGGAVVVDGSKTAGHLRLLQAVGALDLRVAHLVRDGRAVAYAWSKRARNPPVYGSLQRCMWVWMVQNALLEWMARGVRHRTLVRYEDLVRDPLPILAGILRGLDLGHPAPLPDLEQVRPTHGLGGSGRARVGAGGLRLVPDEEWRGRIPALRRIVLGVQGYPTLRRFGYC
jgi:hypothetical protein